jgi:hypothetical protein
MVQCRTCTAVVRKGCQRAERGLASRQGLDLKPSQQLTLRCPAFEADALAAA